MKKIIIPGVLFGATLLLVPPEARATELVYTPVNPSFGGSPLNGTFLLNQADSQNKFKNKVEDSDPFDDFQDNLQRRVLGILANRITKDFAGDEDSPLPTGPIRVGDLVIETQPGVNGVTVVISDTLTGRSTEITVPNP